MVCYLFHSVNSHTSYSEIKKRKESVRKRYYTYVLYFQLKDILRGKNLYGQQKIYQSIYHTMGGVSNRMNGKKHV